MLDSVGVADYCDRWLQEHWRLFHAGVGNIETVADAPEEELSEVKYVDANEGRRLLRRVLP